MSRHFLFAVFAILFFGCDSGETARRLPDQEFYPLQQNWFQIYDVEEITYTLGVPETLRYELKTVISRSFTNNQGGTTFVIDRSRRQEGGTEWVPAETWSVEPRVGEIIQQEGNTPFVVLSFPLTEGRRWNGNRYNSLGGEGNNTGPDWFEITRAGFGVEIQGNDFPDCVEVLQEDNQEFVVYFDRRKDVFARGVGLISREKTQLTYCSDQDRNCLGRQIVDEGVIFRQHIKAYGKE